ncbi:SDR family oxidoreductase [Paenibacillus sp. TH7-28]
MEREAIRDILTKVKNRELHYSDAAERLSAPDCKSSAIEAASNRTQKEAGIAVVGFACRFPGAMDAEAYWRNLCSGRDSVRVMPEGRPRLTRSEQKSAPKRGGFLDSVTTYAAEFFGFSEENLMPLDPQQLLSLEVAYETFGHAGYGNIRNAEEQVGVFWGARGSSITVGHLSKGMDYEIQESDRNYILGRAPNMIAARIADFLNLRGPVIVSDTACSSSLVSVHLACQSIRNGECDMALAGGVDLLIDPDSYVGLEKAKALSPEGICHTFDRKANGYVPGEGAGAVLLKPYDLAVRDGDCIYAVIAGSAVNNDGHTIGLTTPDLEGQKNVIRRALRASGVRPREISYMESHGTGTTIGDPIEFKALSTIYREDTERPAFCAIGSVKTNIGHLHCAAGIAGLLKLVLALHYKVIPPTLHCEEPNPRLELESSPFYVADRQEPWPSMDGGRKAAISSFGFGGTNCHMIVEEGPRSSTSYATECLFSRPELFILSARKESELARLASEHRQYIEARPELPLSSICFTVQRGRECFPHRLAVVASDREKLLGILGCPAEAGGPIIGLKTKDLRKRKVLMFAGQGSLYPSAAAGLYKCSEIFRNAIKECDRHLGRSIGTSIMDALVSPSYAARLQHTALSQPITFALDYALAKLWMTWGYAPSALIGHSLGEYAAACIAGVFSLEEAALLVAERGRLMQELPPGGSMAVVFDSPANVWDLIEKLSPSERGLVSIAAENGVKNTVVSGSANVVRKVIEQSSESGVKSTPLQVSHAFHSHLMEPVLESYSRTFRELGIVPSRPSIPIVSNLTGDWHPGSMDESYWLRHIMEPVKFGPGIHFLLERGHRIFLEAGPGTTLTTMTKDLITGEDMAFTKSSLGRGREDAEHILETAAQLFVQGVDFKEITFETVRKVTALPVYAFPYRDYGARQRKYPRSVDGMDPVCAKTGESVGLQISPLESGMPKGTESADSCLLGMKVSSDDDEEIVYVKRLDRTLKQLFEHHRVDEVVVMPGVCLWEAAAAAARKAFGWPACRLREVSHNRPLIIEPAHQGEGSLRIRLMASRQNREEESEGQEVQFVVEFQPEGEEKWLEHCSGTVSELNDEPVPRLDLAALTSRIGQPEDGKSAFYTHLQQLKLEYGPLLQGAEAMAVQDREALITLSVPSEGSYSNAFYLYHPAILDGALQGISLMLDRTFSDSYMPFYSGSVKLFGTLPPRAVAYLELNMSSAGQEIVRTKARIMDEEGFLLVEIDDFCLKKVRSGFLRRQVGDGKEKEKEKEKEGELFFKPVWVKTERREPAPVLYGTAVVFYREEEAEHVELLNWLERLGISLLRVRAGGSREDYEAILNRLEQDEKKSLVFIHLCPFTGSKISALDQERLLSAQAAGALSLLSLVQALSTRRTEASPRLIVVTANAQPVLGSGDVLAPENATAAGIIQNISLEFGGISSGYVDLDKREGDFRSMAEAVLQEAFGASPQLLTAYRLGDRYTRVILRHPMPASLSSAPVVRAGGVYIISGGLGGLGLVTGCWLASQGAGAIVLAGRSPFPDESEWERITSSVEPGSERIRMQIESIRQMQANGAKVMIRRTDVTDVAQASDCVRETKQAFGAVNGVIHAAGVLRDGLLINMSQTSYEQVVNPKMLGAWALDRATENEQLDFFVLYSGLVSYVGIIGQGNHSAANWFEDSYAHYRSSVLNRPTLTVNWGIWGATGVVANSFYRDNLSNQGYMPLTTKEALYSLEQVLRNGMETQIGIGHINGAQAARLSNPYPSDSEALLTIGFETMRQTEFLRLIEHAEAVKDRLFREVDMKQEAEFGVQLDKLCALYCLEYFQGNGVFVRPEPGVSLEEILEKCSVQTKYVRMLSAMLHMVKEEGLIASDGNRFWRDGKQAQPDIAELRASLEKNFNIPDIYTSIVSHCMKHYPEVLRGEMNPMQVLFPRGSSDILAPLYHMPSPYNDLAAYVAEECVRIKAAGRGTVNILEIGAGTGGTTARILPRIANLPVSYTYTDISPVLVHKAKTNFAEYEFVDYRVLNIEKSPDLQGFEGKRYDIVVAANVLHATARLRDTMNHVQALMTPGAILLMVETTKVVRYADLIFGITDGWWKYEDEEFRESSALLEPDVWEAAMPSLGFERAVCLPLDRRQSVRLPLSVIVAQYAGSAEPRATAAASAAIAIAKPDGEVRDNRNFTKNSGVGETDLYEHVFQYLEFKASQLLNRPFTAVGPDTGFMEAGLDSLALVTLTSAIEKDIGIKLYPTLFFEYQTFDQMSLHLSEKYNEAFTVYVQRNIAAAPDSSPNRENPQESDSYERDFESEESVSFSPERPVKDTDIAVIGMAGMFPEANDIEEFWDNLVSGRDSVREIGPERWDAKVHYGGTQPAAGKTISKWAGWMEGIADFDAAFFNISPKEAKRMDPQQRLFLQVAWSAFENSGYCGQRLPSRTGIFAGVSNHHYHQLTFDPEDTFSALATSNAMVANRLSYFLNVNGPSLSIDTQCSSSLVALNSAILSLIHGECELALAGGINLVIPAEYYSMLSQIKALSSDGKCRTFDKRANGFVSGEGVCAVVIKPLKKALEDGDRIHAVIKGISVNHDGRSSQLAAPNPKAQTAVVTEALRQAGVPSDTISYVEAHGTGTPLGDPVEISALKSSFEDWTERKSFCAIGSVKTNIGHLESAAGLAGVTKVVMAMKHRLLPPHLHFREANPNTLLEDTPFYINDRAVPWTSPYPLRAGVSSFGMGGANAHVILEEAPRQTRAVSGRAVHVAALSAKSMRSLAMLSSRLQVAIMRNPQYSCDDIAYSLGTGRAHHFPYRMACVYSSREELLQCLEAMSREETRGSVYFNHVQPSVRKSRILFVFSGKACGANGLELCCLPRFNYYAKPFSEALKLSRPSALFNLAAASSNSLDVKSQSVVNIARTAFEYAVARVLMDWGITPLAVTGAGEGDFTARILSGDGELHTIFRELCSGEEPHDLPSEAIQTITAPGSLIRLEKATDDFDDVIEISSENAGGLKELFLLLAHAYAQGISVHWDKIAADFGGNMLDLPNYAFERERFWDERVPVQPAAEVKAVPTCPDGCEEPDRLEIPIFESFCHGNRHFGNRIVKSAIETALGTPEGIITEAYIEQLKSWQSCGAGITISGNIMIGRQARSAGREIVISREQPQHEMLERVVRTMKDTGAIAIIQLNHAGPRANQGAEPNGWSFEALSETEIVDIIERFTESAGIAVLAGADGVQLHAAHGYLLSQSLSPAGNRRTDRWGGSFAGRLSLLAQTISAIRTRIGRGPLLSVKLDIPRKLGLTAPEKYELLRILEDIGVDMIELSTGPDARNSLNSAERAERIRELKALKASVSIPVVFTGGLRSGEEISEYLKEGAADLIGLARPFICEPDFLERLQRDKDYVSFCRNCNMCLLGLTRGRLKCVHQGNRSMSGETPTILYKPVWKEETIRDKETEDRIPWLVFDPRYPSNGELGGHTTFGCKDQNMVIITGGSQFTRHSAYSYSINFENNEDYHRAVRETARDHGGYFRVVHLGGLFSESTSGADVDRKLEESVLSLLSTVQALNRCDEIRLADVLIPTTGVQNVFGEPVYAPMNALMTGLARVIPYESSKLRCVTFDFAPGTVETAEIEEICSEEARHMNEKYTEVAYREGTRYLHSVEPYSGLTRNSMDGTWVRKGGCYLLTGGLGGLGMTFAALLAERGAGRLILTGRSSPPQTELLRRIKGFGTEVHYRSVDVSDSHAMQKLLEEITASFGALDGVFHCSGILDSVHRSLLSKSNRSFRNVLLPKVHGGIALFEALNKAGQNTCFVLMCSSIASVHGKFGAGLGDYAAANAFLDSLSQSVLGSHKGPVLSVNWSLWEGVGLGAIRPQSDGICPLDKEEGISALDYLLSHSLNGNMIVMKPEGYKSLKDESIITKNVTKIDHLSKFARKTNNIKGNYYLVEKYIISLISKFLQFPHDKIDKRTPFQDYGIDSVTVTDMIGALESEYGVYTHPSIILDYPDTQSLARYLIDELGVASSEGTLAVEGPGIVSCKDSQSGQYCDEGRTNALASDEERLRSLLTDLYDGNLEVKEAIGRLGGFV